ncbi:unnamed protein product [Adineta steineri]|uniref:Uncharacterized protein n=1 Tax=Adineta steineri TaxID=433720 RepID=A0A813TUB1_9BILA|nr:unnamed protein product [Adineta steineri]
MGLMGMMGVIVIMGLMVIRQSSIFANDDTHDAEVTNNNSGKSTIISDSFVNFETDQALSDLYKAIVGDLVKNPKTFKGNKDDVNKWFENIEHLLNVAHISDSIRLDIISCSLRGDALEWFKNDQSSFTTCSVFVRELKRASF